MKKSFKQVISGVLTAAIAVLGVSFSAFAATTDVSAVTQAEKLSIAKLDALILDSSGIDSSGVKVYASSSDGINVNSDGMIHDFGKLENSIASDSTGVVLTLTVDSPGDISSDVIKVDLWKDSDGTIASTASDGIIEYTSNSSGVHNYKISKVPDGEERWITVTISSDGTRDNIPYNFYKFKFKTISTSIGEPDTLPSGAIIKYEFYAEIPGNSNNPSTRVTNSAGGQDLAIWVGGGKSTLKTGTIVDGKTTQLQLYAVDENGKHYNITTAKSTVWGVQLVAPTENSKPTLTNGKFNSSSAKSSAKISKGKISVGKSIPADGKVYAVAFANVVKTSTGYTYDYAGYVEINVRKAVNAVVVSSVNAYNDGKLTLKDTDIIKTINVPVGGAVYTTSVPTLNQNLWVNIYPVGGNKSGKIVTSPVAANEYDYNTYTVAVAAASQEYLRVAKNSKLTTSASYTAAELKNGVQLVGVSMKEGKPVKVTVTITNDQSGKKVSFSAVVCNPVVGINATKAPNNVITLATPIIFTAGTAKTDTSIVSEIITNALILGDTSLATTDKAVVSVFNKVASEISLTDLVDKGKLKAKQVTTGVSASMKASGLEIKASKNATAGKYTIAIAYNMGMANGNLTGVVFVEVKVNADASTQALKTLKIGDDSFTITATTTTAQLTKTAIGGLTVDAIPGASDSTVTITCNPDTAYSDDTKKLTMSDGSTATLTIKVKDKEDEETSYTITVKAYSPKATLSTLKIGNDDVNLINKTVNLTNSATDPLDITFVASDGTGIPVDSDGISITGSDGVSISGDFATGYKLTMSDGVTNGKLTVVVGKTDAEKVTYVITVNSTTIIIVTADGLTSDNYNMGSVIIYKGSNADGEPAYIVSDVATTNMLTVKANLLQGTQYYIVINTGDRGKIKSTTGEIFTPSSGIVSVTLTVSVNP